jgi:NADH-quinone oxidoreductase subunit F
VAAQEVKIVLEYDHLKDPHLFSTYQSVGGYKTFKKVIKDNLKKEVVEIVKASGLRGRGGAGFPTGMKWGFFPTDQPGMKYLVNNADEGEPGTFKDRYLMNRHPHSFIEGMLIASFALNIPKSYIYVRGEFKKEAQIIQHAIDEATRAGLMGDNILKSGFSHHMVVHRGAGAYICGEETGLLSSLEGKKGMPKLKPPFPALKGLWGKPTIVNNTETLANIPYIIREGAEKYRKNGTEKSPGTRLFSISGRLKKPGVYEIPMGMPLMTFVNEICGGMQDGYKLKAIIPGGASSCLMKADECDEITLDFECLANKKSMLGSGAVIVIDDKQSITNIAKVTASFFHHESCGQCTPCREGTGWIEKIVNTLLEGKGKKDDIKLVQNICTMMMGKTICALSDAAAMPTLGFIQKFPEEFEALVQS